MYYVYISLLLLLYTLGDIDRMCSQESRGGGAMCVQDASLWIAFNSIVASVESCYKYNPCGGSSTQCYWCSPSALPSSAPLSMFPTLSSPTMHPSMHPNTRYLTSQTQVVETQRLYTGAGGGGFGVAVSISGNTIIVGANQEGNYIHLLTFIYLHVDIV